MRTNRDITTRLQRTGACGKNTARGRLTEVVSALRDVLDELRKGDSLIVKGLGRFEMQLEPWRWIYVPQNLLKKFVKSKPKRWRLVFTPCDELERHLHAQCPDEIVVYRPVPAPKASKTPKDNA